MPIELRWAVSPYTTGDKPVLQYRETRVGLSGQFISEWIDVPVVVVDLKPAAKEGT